MALTTARLLLRPITHRDNSALLPLLNHVAVKQFNDYGDNLSATDLKCMIQLDIERRLNNCGGRFGIFSKHRLSLLGSVGFYQEHDSEAGINIGYELAPNHWGKGIMYEAISALFAQRSNLPFQHNTVFARVHPNNLRSKTLITRLGFSELTQQHVYRKELNNVVITEKTTAHL